MRPYRRANQAIVRSEPAYCFICRARIKALIWHVNNQAKRRLEYTIEGCPNCLHLPRVYMEIDPITPTYGPKKIQTIQQLKDELQFPFDTREAIVALLNYIDDLELSKRVNMGIGDIGASGEDYQENDDDYQDWDKQDDGDINDLKINDGPYLELNIGLK